MLSGKDLSDYLNNEKSNILTQKKEKKEKDNKKRFDEMSKKDLLNDPSKNIILEGNENSVNYYLRTINDFPPSDLPKVSDDLKKNIESGIIVLFGTYEKFPIVFDFIAKIRENPKFRPGTANSVNP